MAKAMNFTLYVNDAEKEMKFYSEVLGWGFTKMPMGNHYGIDAGAKEEQGIGGFMEPREGNREKNTEVRSTVNHYRVSDYDKMIAAVKAMGGKILDEFDMGEMGRHATLEDPEGNVFGAMWVNPNFKPPARPEK